MFDNKLKQSRSLLKLRENLTIDFWRKTESDIIPELGYEKIHSEEKITKIVAKEEMPGNAIK